MTAQTHMRNTLSVCPDCLRVLDAEVVREGGAVYMRKRCPQHGEFSALVWSDGQSYEAWGERELCSDDGAGDCDGGACCGDERDGKGGKPDSPDEPDRYGRPDSPDKTDSPDSPDRPTAAKLPCPSGCLNCDEHRTRPCCVLFEVTERCDLGCPVCFAGAKATGECSSPDPSIETIAAWYDELKRRAGICNIQLSGGEPTLRDDLPNIIQIGMQKGFDYFQLNTNGLRLGSEPNLALTLKQAGLSCVFLQFDGFDVATNEQLRGRQLVDVKTAAIKNCAAAGLPVVLVPTLAKGINDHELMAIIEFGITQMPCVRGVHIQPLSGFGRCAVDASAARMTIPDVLAALESQSGGMIARAHFSGGAAENPYCSFSANYLVDDAGRLEHLGGASATGCACQVSACEAAGDGENPHTPDAVAIAQDTQKRRWAPDIGSLEPALSSACLPSLSPEPSRKAPTKACQATGATGTTKVGSLDDWLARSKLRSFSITGMAFMDAQNLDFERLQSCYIFVMSRVGRPVPFCAYNLTDAGGEGLYR